MVGQTCAFDLLMLCVSSMAQHTLIYSEKYRPPKYKETEVNKKTTRNMNQNQEKD